MIMKDKTYDRIKVISLIIVPVIAFVSKLLEIWNVPYTEQITATLLACDVLFGALVTIAKKVYDKKLHEEE